MLTGLVNSTKSPTTCPCVIKSLTTEGFPAIFHYKENNKTERKLDLPFFTMAEMPPAVSPVQ